jgi:DHA1 family tetracycline resistance protein-like MFS transporter
MSQAESGPQKVAPATPPGAMGIIFLIVLMDLLGFGIIIPLLPLYAQQYKASPVQVGLLLSVYSICQFVASPIMGAFSDKHGRRVVLVFSQFGSAVGYLLLGLVMQFHWRTPAMALGLFYLSRLIDGISGGNVSTAQAYISDVTTQENRAKGMGLIGAAFGVGFALGPSIGGLLSAVHPALPGYAAAVASSVAMVLTYLRLPESRQHKPTESAAWLHPSQFRPIFANRRLTQLLLIFFLSMCGFVMLESMGALFVSRSDTFGWTPRAVGLYFGYMGLVIVIVQGGMIGRLTRRFGEWPLAIIGPLFVALGMANLVYMSFRPLVWLLFLGSTLSSSGRSLQTPTLFSLISKNGNPRQQGIVFGLNQGLSSLARAIGPLLGGLVYAIHPSGPFALAAGLLTVACLWTVMLRRRGDSPLAVAAEAA